MRQCGADRAVSWFGLHRVEAVVCGMGGSCGACGCGGRESLASTAACSASTRASNASAHAGGALSGSGGTVSGPAPAAESALLC